MSDAPPQPNGQNGRMRVRVPAGSQTRDSLQNFAARYGLSTANLLSYSTYTFHPVTRLQQLMEFAYRGSWIVGAAVDSIADDMTRAGIQFNTEMDPDQVEQLQNAMNEVGLWQGLNEAIKWGRLYGGGLAVMMIDGQDPATPLDPRTVPLNGFKGLLVLDRWMVQPSYKRLVQELGPDYGKPEWYQVISTAPFMPALTAHYTRCLRFDGIVLPFRQRIAENGWGMSVIERLYDVLQGFNSGTTGAAQLLFKAYLRTYKVEGFHRMISAGGEALENMMQSLDMMRMLQSNEGMSVIDKLDEFETHEYNFGGVADTIMMLGQQVSGALGIPLVRLFGQSPAGLNSTGEADLRNYYDMVRSTQEARLRRPLTRLLDVLAFSVLGGPPPDSYTFGFVSLRQLDEIEKSEIAERDAATINAAHSGGIITTQIAMKELKQSSIVTGRFTNITEEDIEASEAAPDPWDQPPGMPGGPGGAAGAPGAGGKLPGMRTPGPGGVHDPGAMPEPKE